MEVRVQKSTKEVSGSAVGPAGRGRSSRQGVEGGLATAGSHAPLPRSWRT